MSLEVNPRVLISSFVVGIWHTDRFHFAANQLKLRVTAQIRVSYWAHLQFFFPSLIEFPLVPFTDG